MNSLNKLFRLIIGILTIQIIFSIPILAFPNFLPEQGIYVFEENSGDVILAQNENQLFEPASTTKLMTAIVMLENIQDLSQIVTCGDEVLDYDWQDSEAGLWVDQKMSYDQLLNAMLIPSGNDAAGTIAVNVGRVLLNNPGADKITAQNAFVDEMNKRAEELGTLNTHFMNPTGRGDALHRTTPRDFALIAQEAFKHDEIVNSTSTKKYPITSIKGFTYDLINTDLILFPTQGEIGVVPDAQLTPEQQQQILNQPNPMYTSLLTAGKTGTTEDRKRTFVFYSKIGEANIIGILFNHPDQEIFTQAKSIIEEINNNYNLNTIDQSSVTGEINLNNTSFRTGNCLHYSFNNPIISFTKPEDLNNLSKEIRWNPNYIQDNGSTFDLIQNINTGNKIGAIIFRSNNNVIKTVPVYAQENIFIKKNIFDDPIVIIGVIAVFFILLLVIILKIRKTKKVNSFNRRTAVTSDRESF